MQGATMKTIPNWAIALALLIALTGVNTESVRAQTFTSLYTFPSADGGQPAAGLVQATNGDFYGTTLYSTVNDSGGTVFKITPSGELTSFSLGAIAYPAAALIQATNGDLYGTTTAGGANGYGSVFKMSLRGAPTTIYSFCSQGAYPTCADGLYPESPLIQATNGDLYGTTTSGGVEFAGTIFRITPEGTLTTLYTFCAQGGFCSDGGTPVAGLILATNGDFYGTTEQGGGINNSGTVFKVTADGALTTLYSFCSQTNCADGKTPTGLIQAANGDLYGTTQSGGTTCNCGTVFKITLDGHLTTLVSFNGTDGLQPSGLIQATDGDFYGTTYNLGTHSAGTVFKITAAGTLTTLYSFCAQSGCSDGGNPLGGVLQATNGAFYGTTAFGGANNGDGTVFSLSVGLAPFVETQTTSGKVGSAVVIIGNSLTGATSVTFNGTAATFTVNSTGSAITATVPTGATSGKVKVATPGGVLSSSKPFTVKR
jgi:uncharacterized repeat protein (TIGR03803 family)